MTIPTTQNLHEREQNKKNDKVPEDKVPLTGVLAATIVAAPVTRRCGVARVLCLTLACLLLLLIAGLTSYYIYSYMRPKNVGICGVQYQDPQYPVSAVEDPEAYKYTHDIVRKLEEEIEVDLRHDVSTIRVPSFDECQAAIIMHDFARAYSVIVDLDHFRCFIWPLNTTLILPPRNLWDMVAKMKTRYYVPNLRVIRQDFRVTWPPVAEVADYGPYIQEECQFFDSYWLERVTFTGRVKRSANQVSFGEFGNERNIVKYSLQLPKQLRK